MEVSFQNQDSSGRAFRGYPLFVEHAFPNAFAIKHHGLNICGLHVGLVAAVFEISLFVFAQATLFPEIGDPALERSPSLPDIAALAFWMSDRLRESPAGGGEPVGAAFVPKDGGRQLAAHFLTQLMLRFVWLHELYHCLNGHTGLMAMRHQDVALYEMPEGDAVPLVETGPAVDAQWTLVQHCMEFDADRTAFWAMTRMQEADAEPIEGLAAMPRALWLKLVVFASIMMTFLFDQATRRSAIKTGSTHPLAYHRLHNLTRTLASNLLDPSGTMKAAFCEVMTEMTRMKERVPQLVSSAQLLHDLAAVDLQQAFDQIEDAIYAARGQFAPFAFRQTSPS